LKVLKVIHGYPPLYSAGSEVYSQTLCNELVAQGHQVMVFTRQENAYEREYTIEWGEDPLCPEIKIAFINMAHSKDGYRHQRVDEAFRSVALQFKPDIVHIGHLNHLSTSIVNEAGQLGLPILFTLHDFWLMCPRGQFLQAIQSKGEDLYPVCDSQENEKCARHCYWRYFSSQDDQEDIDYWTRWVERRMDHIQEDLLSKIDLFHAPSRYLMNRFLSGFPIPSSQMVYLDYGFHRERLHGRQRTTKSPFTFGYIGTHKQAKGIFHLLQAFHQLNHPEAELKIWGSPLQPFTKSLKEVVAKMPVQLQEKIHWMGGYSNTEIVADVFNHIDAIVVPSIWGENSPLVIHEALEARVGVITANYGGMSEYVHHEVNGLLFEHRSPQKLAEQMGCLADDPELLSRIQSKGYVQSDDHHIPSIKEHTRQIVSLYQHILKKRKTDDEKTRPLAHHI
jgi:glycosyltransferase involved in cell wall biosynthesis